MHGARAKNWDGPHAEGTGWRLRHRSFILSSNKCLLSSSYVSAVRRPGDAANKPIQCVSLCVCMCVVYEILKSPRANKLKIDREIGTVGMVCNFK